MWSRFHHFLRDSCKRTSLIVGFGLDGFRSDNGSDSGNDKMPPPQGILCLCIKMETGLTFNFMSLEIHGVDIEGIPFKGKIDTFDLVECAIHQHMSLRVPEKFQFTTI